MRDSRSPRICLVLARPTCEGLRRTAAFAMEKSPDLIEIRLDALRNPFRAEDLAWVRDLGVPVIGTLRPSWEGGAFGRSEEERMGLLREVAGLFSYVDLELRAATQDLVRDLERSGPRLLISHHDFRTTPDWQRLIYYYGRARAAKGDAVKIATVVRSGGDLLRLLSLHQWARDLVVVPMGREGRMGRVLAPLFGSLFAYASLDGSPAVAPGMLTIGQMRRIYGELAALAGDGDPW